MTVFLSEKINVFDDGEDICSLVWVHVVMTGGVSENETNSVYW